MVRIGRRLVVAAAAVLGMAGMPAYGQSQGGCAIVATESSGSVQMQAGNNAARPLQAGKPIDVDTLISTGPGGAVALVFADGQIVALGGNTRFRISACRYTPQEPDKSGVALNLIEGSARVVMGAIGQHDPRLVRVQVGTGTLTGAPDPGGNAPDAGVTVQGALTLLEVSQGRVSLTVPSGQSYLVGTGEGALVGADGNVTQGRFSGIQTQVGQMPEGKDLVSALDIMQSFAFPQRERQTVITLVTPSSSNPAQASAANSGQGAAAGAGASGTTSGSTSTSGTTATGPVASAGDSSPLPTVDVGVDELPPTGDIGPQLNLPPLVTATTGTATTGASGGGNPCNASCS